MRTRLSWSLLGIMVLSVGGCVSSQDLEGMRKDLTSEIQETRARQDQMMAQQDMKRKAGEETQARLAKDLKAQEQTLSGISAKLQDLQTRQEALQRERLSGQGTSVALRETILRALRAEQADLQQRQKKLADYIRDVEQTDTVGMTTKPTLVPTPFGEARPADKPASQDKPGETGPQKMPDKTPEDPKPLK